MPIKYGAVSREDYEAVINGIYGSMEAYYACPELKEVCNRIEYLEKLKSDVGDLIKKEREETKAWNVISHAKQYLGFLFIPRFNNDLDKMINRYKSIRPLPFALSLNAANNTFDFFINSWKGVIKNRNKKLGINDEYVGE